MERGIHEGMEVEAADGERLGVVVRCADGELLIERGLFLPRAFRARSADVAEVRDGQVILSRRREELERAEPQDARVEEAQPAAPPPRLIEGGREEIRVPLVQEEAVVDVVPRRAGAVRIRKRVVTEVKTFTVQVRREELEVERVRGGDGAAEAAAGEAGAARFEEQSFVIPLYEEEVRFEKRPVLYEEVHVTKVVQSEPSQARVRVRREVAEVEEQGHVTHAAPEPAPETH